jgi:hypothetical protein
MYRPIICAFALSCAALGGAGCYASAGVPGADVELTSAPVDIDTYPSVYYEGRPAYFYHDHWYYREGRAWRYYHTEPRFLFEHRRRYHR